MAKTAKQVQTDIIKLLEGSILAEGVNGAIYRATPESSYRPRDSRMEDIEVIFTSGLPDQIQTGVVTLRIWVPDIDPYANGVLVENGARTAEIEALAQRWVDSLKAGLSNYLFRLQQTIGTEAEPDIAQHFVSVRLSYRYYE